LGQLTLGKPKLLYFGHFSICIASNVSSGIYPLLNIGFVCCFHVIFKKLLVFSCWFLVLLSWAKPQNFCWGMLAWVRCMKYGTLQAIKRQAPYKVTRVCQWAKQKGIMPRASLIVQSTNARIDVVCYLVALYQILNWG
jgi:hypothetical protein